MPLVQATLGAELGALAPVETELEAIDNFAAAFETYFADASVTGLPTTPGTLTPATAAMKGAMTGMSVAGAAAIQAGITAFWGVVAASGLLIWPSTMPPIASITPPPGLAGISAALAGVFTANTAGKLDLVASANAIAGAIHPTQLGGLALITPPPPGMTQPIL